MARLSPELFSSLRYALKLDVNCATSRFLILFISLGVRERDAFPKSRGSRLAVVACFSLPLVVLTRDFFACADGREVEDPRLALDGPESAHDGRKSTFRRRFRHFSFIPVTPPLQRGHA